MAIDLNLFMATMVSPSVAVPPDDAEKVARDFYGLEAKAVRLTGERDENFKLTDARGIDYVLKIANAAEDPSVSDLPTAALLHIERVDPGFPCPRMLRTRDDRTQVRYKDAVGKMRTARILTYLPGRSLISSTRSRPQRIACGRAAARLGLALRNFVHPAAKRPLIWDLRHVAGTLPLLDELADFPQRSAVGTLIEGIHGRIAVEFEALRQQVVHNDMNNHNVLVGPDDDDVVAAIIDFGDLAHTALVADVAIAAADQITDDVSPHDAILDLVVAYHEAVPLMPREIAMLNALIAGRLLMDVLITSWHMVRNPDSKHYTRLSPNFIHARIEIARELLSRGLTL